MDTLDHLVSETDAILPTSTYYNGYSVEGEGGREGGEREGGREEGRERGREGVREGGREVNVNHCFL